MTVRAKFVCLSNQGDKTSDGEMVHTILFRPVYGGNAENDAFFKWTPSGELRLGVVKATVAEQFTVGNEYYVDINPCPVYGDDGEGIETLTTGQLDAA